MLERNSEMIGDNKLSNNTFLATGLFSVFCFFLLASVLIRIDSWDIWWHLHIARHIISTGEIPDIDIFTILGNGRPYLDSHWLFQILIYSLTVVFGFSGFSLYQASVFALIFIPYIFLPGKSWKELTNLSITIPLAALGVCAVSHRFLPRPELFTYLFISTFILFFERYRKTGSKVVFLIPLLMVVWQNTHALFVIGYFIIGVYLAEDLWERRQDGVLRGLEIRPLVIVFFLSLLAYFANPHGLSLIKYSYLLSTEVGAEADPFMRIITELVPTFSAKNIRSFQFPFYVILSFLAILAVFARGKKLLKSHLVILAVFFVLSFTAHRNTVIFIVAAIPLTIINLSYARFHLPIILQKIIVTIFVLLMVIQSVRLVSSQHYKDMGLITKFGLGISQLYYPAGAVQFIKDNRVPGNIGHFDNFGGYLMYELSSVGYKPLFDGRWEVYDHEYLYDLFLSVEKPVEFLDKMVDLDINTMMVYYLRSGNRPLLKYLYNSKEWYLAYFDQYSALFIRRSKAAILSDAVSEVALSDALERLQFDDRKSAIGPGLSDVLEPLVFMGAKKESVEVSRKILRSSQPSILSYEVLAEGYVSGGQYREALTLIHAAETAGFQSAKLFYQKAVVLNIFNKPKEAIIALEKALQLQPESTEYNYFRTLLFRRLNIVGQDGKNSGNPK